MTHIIYNSYQNTKTVIPIETKFQKHNRAHFLFLLQKRNLSAAWDVPWVWQTRVLMEEEEHSVKCSWRKRGVYAWSENCIQVQLRIFPVELYVLEIGHLIAASVQVLSPHTEEYFVFHLHCSLLVLCD